MAPSRPRIPALSRKVTPSPQKKPTGVLKKSNTKFGAKIVRLYVGESAQAEEHTIHEDLLCQNSPFFRQLLQPNRRLSSDEHGKDCSICYESLDHSTQNLTYCAGECGTTFHRECMKAWLKDKTPALKTCPMCRNVWSNEENVIKEYNFPRWRRRAFNVYLEWLYRRHICFQHENEDSITNGIWKQFVITYVLGAKIGDDKFCTALLVAGLEILEEIGLYPDHIIVADVYKYTGSNSPLRRFMAGIYARRPNWMDEDRILSLYKPKFLVDVIRESQAVFGAHGHYEKITTCNMEDMEDMKEKFGMDADHASGYHAWRLRELNGS